MKEWDMGKYRELCALCGGETPKEKLSATDLCPRFLDALAAAVIALIKQAKGRYRRQPWRDIQTILQGHQ